jgi:nitroreductase
MLKMADIIDLIQSRRSVKKFLPKFVSWENIAKVIDAGRHAPSSGNLQNWKFIALYEPEAKEALAKLCYEQYEIAAAGALIVVCGEPEKGERYYGDKGVKKYTTQNCAAAIENMLLEAHSLGLGSCWIGAFDEEEVRLLLKIPGDVTVEAIVAIGYAQGIPEKPPKYPLETVVYFHQWRNKMRDPAKYMNDISTILARRRGSVGQTVQGMTAKIEQAAHSVAEKLKRKEE